MNIVWLTWKDLDHPLAGGAEVVNEELAARLTTAGHTVTLLTGGFAGAAPTATRRGFTIIRTGGRFTTYFTTARYFMKHRQELAAGLVIDECNTLPYCAGWYARAPTVLFAHMLCRRIWFYELPWPLGLVGYVAEPIYLRLLKRTPVITVSQSTKTDLIHQGFKPSAVHIISQGIQLAPAADLAALAKFTQPTLLSLGSIRPMKRTLDQIAAFELAKATNPDLRLIVAGAPEGRYGQKVIERIKSSPYAASIKYAGHVTPAQKLSLMQKSHLILVTSVKEGWGLIVTEAASQGTPAVVYDVDGLRDSVRHQRTGLITSRNNPPALAQSIAELLSQPELYERYRTAAWQWSKTIHFDQSYADFAAILKLKP